MINKFICHNYSRWDTLRREWWPDASHWRYEAFAPNLIAEWHVIERWGWIAST